MANLREVVRTTQDTASKPHSVPLHHILEDIDLDGLGCLSRIRLVLLQSVINSLLNLLIQSLVKTLKQGGASRQHNVLVESSSRIDGATLNRDVHHLVQWLSPVLMNEFLFLKIFLKIFILTGWKNISGPKNLS